MPADFIVDLSLATLFSLLKELVKNPAKKAELKKALLKLRNNINALYPED